MVYMHPTIDLIAQQHIDVTVNPPVMSDEFVRFFSHLETKELKNGIIYHIYKEAPEVALDFSI